ncbi:MAG: MBL fold metallo-hydrolase [Anaerolineaceae bacterium]
MTDQIVYQLTENVLVRQSALYQTNSSAVILDSKVMVIDPGVFRADLDAFGALLSPFQVVAGLITHAHWDHILWTPSLGNGSRYCSIGTDCQMMADEASLRAALDQVETDSAGQYGYWVRTRFFEREPLVPGNYDLHGFHFELIDLPGHCPGQAGFVFPDLGMAFVGDLISDMEVPTVPSRAAIADYLATLDKLERLLSFLTWIIPGHGTPANPAEALERIGLDRAYLSKLVSNPGVSNLAPDLSSARAFLEELGEHRAFSNDGWGMHIENLTNIARG